MECVVSAVVEKRLGALSVAAEFLRRLDVASAGMLEGAATAGGLPLRQMINANAWDASDYP
ncbi:hypothetical protein GCM10010211_51830 [Streptomyces albospinus]|uniref:Transposase n=1 Tax=Streptomyces albospinus TaxID=285515 RepID=A0ABQ2VEM0_9ACTN|nr:hypothetical protein [Streptomyces albospinus]GGU79441.1 hypothetical protein GCM10010211_51830 [Streptomyces albospinus]